MDQDTCCDFLLLITFVRDVSVTYVTLVPSWREWRMLCRDDIRGFTWEPQSMSDLRENVNEYWLVDFAYLSHSLFIGNQVHPLIRFPLRSRECVPGTQRWTIKIVAWGHNVSVPSIRETRVMYVSETFPICRSLRVMS